MAALIISKAPEIFGFETIAQAALLEFETVRCASVTKLRSREMRKPRYRIHASVELGTRPGLHPCGCGAITSHTERYDRVFLAETRVTGRNLHAAETGCEQTLIVCYRETHFRSSQAA